MFYNCYDMNLNKTDMSYMCALNRCLNVRTQSLKHGENYID